MSNRNAAAVPSKRTPEFRAALDNAGMVKGGGSREGLLQFTQADDAKWKQLLDSGAEKLEN
jgi:hypothetical protein